VIAVTIPLAIAASWPARPPPVRDLPALIFVLVVALVARFRDVGPAIASTLTFAGVLWFRVFPGWVLSSHDTRFHLLTLSIFVGTALAIASLNRQKSERGREAEEMYHSLVEMAPPAFVTESSGAILLANPAFAELLGATRAADVIGMNVHAFVRQTDPAQSKAATEVEGQGWTSARWKKLDGGALEVETVLIPIPDEGRIIYQGFVRDVTDRRRAEEKVEEHRRRLQAFFDTAMDAILFNDEEWRYVDANPAASELLGYSREEILQSRCGDFTAPEEREAVFASWGPMKATGRVSGDRRIIRKNGEIREVEFRSVAVRPGLYCSFLSDITERKAAERGLHQLSGRLLQLQDDERRRIARTLHETTAQNLGAMRLNLSRISVWARDADPVVQDSLSETAALLDESISEIRTLSYVLHPPLIDEAGLLPSLRWLTRGFQERSGITVTLEAPDDLGRLTPEIETAIFRIVQEALTNVQRHSASEAATIRLEVREEALRISIRDQGLGMPLHLRADHLAMTAAGVGIAAMEERVRELGGTMNIASGEGGTIIEVDLPTIEAAHEASEHTHR
jgi:PAS domain S-box-containing protein